MTKVMRRSAISPATISASRYSRAAVAGARARALVNGLAESASRAIAKRQRIPISWSGVREAN